MEYIEYPKWITLPDGRQVIVQSREEEDALLAKKPVGRPPKAKQ